MQTPALGVRTRLCSGRCRAPTPDPRFRPRVGRSDHEILIRYLQPCAAASHTALVAAAGRCYRAHDLRAHDFVLASTGLQLPRHPRELEPGVLCAKAFRFRMQRDAWNGSTPAMDHMMVSISPCHCPSVLSHMYLLLIVRAYLAGAPGRGPSQSTHRQRRAFARVQL